MFERRLIAIEYWGNVQKLHGDPFMFVKETRVTQEEFLLSLGDCLKHIKDDYAHGDRYFIKNK